MPTVLWFRRDLRLADHPALLAAIEDARTPAPGEGRRREGGGDDGVGGVVPLFVVDPALWEPAGAPRQAWLVRSLRSLDERLGGRLVVRHGDPAVVVPALAEQVEASRVYVSADAGVYGRRRDAAVDAALTRAGRSLLRTGTPYAVGPGTVLSGTGTPFKVFGAFQRGWLAHGWPAPAPVPVGAGDGTAWADGVRGEPLPAEPDLGTLRLPEVGEQAALRRWEEFVAGPLSRYAKARNNPGTAGTSQLSAHLKYGEVHPRTLLADPAVRAAGGGTDGSGGRDGTDGSGGTRGSGGTGGSGTGGAAGHAAERFRAELCWREFYADVLWHRPTSGREALRAELARMQLDQPDERFTAWQEGRTGFPMVDAGMRQLVAEGWMHNRTRMIVASFLVKDLHLTWQLGARHFMRWLRDGDLASNAHGWQWVAGTGTDAAPYFRVFNPVTQGLNFDPDADYVRLYVPELRHLRGAAAHEPWKHPDGYAHGYPERIVDHAVEREEALRRYRSIT